MWKWLFGILTAVIAAVISGVILLNIETTGAQNKISAPSPTATEEVEQPSAQLISSDLPVGERLEIGNELHSPNGIYQLQLNNDGNLVLYEGDDGNALWSSNTANEAVAYAILQHDGNLVLYAEDEETAFWDSGVISAPHSDNYVLSVHDDGNLVIKRDDIAVWDHSSQ